ncbi:MAG: agmatine deiminase family protein [Cyanobacteria bacterium KgW148]|nr:agmatine deiminase family protein [Cyanobacteria bacterium KgW148]
MAKRRLPAEWEHHQCCWLAFPSDRDLWEDQLEGAQQEFLALAKTIGVSERLEILVKQKKDEEVVLRHLSDCQVRCHFIPYGDIWLRDTAPLFMKDETGHDYAIHFAWNGWGGKYNLEYDDRVSQAIIDLLQIESLYFNWVLEGGAIEVDGEGTCLTTKQCLLNPNRGLSSDQYQVEDALRSALGATKILWLDRGLLNDHTDGHIDTIARFVAPGKVLCMEAMRCDDPNSEVLTEIAATLANYRDAQGRSLEIIPIPSPGLVLDHHREIMPASYLNFYISNQTVIVPTYDAPWDEDAIKLISQCFPYRNTIGLSAKSILTGGGAFHCITKQQ